MRGTIQPRRLKAKGQLFVVGDLQAASCQRRARGVTDEAFQTGSVVAADAGGRMQRKGAGGETQESPAHRLGNIAQQTPHMLAGAFAGAFAGGQLPLHRSS